MIQSFRNAATEDLFYGRSTKTARSLLPMNIWQQAARKLDALDSADELADLRVPLENRLKRLRGDRAGQHGIRINDQYTICFIWSGAGPQDVEIADYH